MNILHISPYVLSAHAGGVLMGLEVETLKKYVYIVYDINNDKDKQLAKEYTDNESDFL